MKGVINILLVFPKSDTVIVYIIVNFHQPWHTDEQQEADNGKEEVLSSSSDPPTQGVN